MNALVVDDDDLIRSNVAEVLSTDGWDVSEAESAEEALALLPSRVWSLVFCDVRLSAGNNHEGYDVLRRFSEVQPSAQIILMTGHGSAVGALDAVSSGAYDYLMKPFEISDIKRISQAVRRSMEKRERRRISDELPPSPMVYTSDIDLVGVSAAFVEVMKLVGRVASTNLPVLITGESGTGKEIVARAIHRRSLRAEHPFVAVNCGALPAELIESELFGHVRGSFTGATVDRRGLWQEADHGTVFLDEITETSLAFQVKLLRALQEGEIRRVGSNQTQRVDARVIVATNRDVEQEVHDGRFRQDLLFRLNTIEISLPSLRDRRDDIMLLAKNFLRQHAQRYRKQIGGFDEVARDRLLQHSFPGNVRELDHVIERAVLMSHGSTIKPNDLGLTTTAGDSRGLEDMSLEEVEAFLIKKALARNNGNARKAAEALGLSRSAFYRRLQQYGL